MMRQSIETLQQIYEYVTYNDIKYSIICNMLGFSDMSRHIRLHRAVSYHSIKEWCSETVARLSNIFIAKIPAGLAYTARR